MLISMKMQASGNITTSQTPEAANRDREIKSRFVAQQTFHTCGESPLASHLDCKGASDALDRVGQVDPLVDGDDVRLTGRHPLQQAATAADIQDDGQIWVRFPHAVNHLLDVGPSKHVKVLRL